MQTTTARIRRLSETKIQKGTAMKALEVRPPQVIDLHSLEGEKINPRILARGVELRKRGRVHQNDLYPWRFYVSGDDTPTGTTLYIVDLSTYECSCLWFQNTRSTCKHLVAALLIHMEQTTPKVG